ncbi:MAG TPA: TlpA disulfide reductase family protein [Phycisphaerae bacterium]|nr:TlpA disulfide reductase family protein [Phycisphaerae bacterium]
MPRLILLLLLLILPAACNRQSDPDPTGTYRGTITNPSTEQVAFTLDIVRTRNTLSVALRNYDEILPASSVTQSGNTLKIRFDYYDATLDASLAGDTLTGTFTRQWQKKTLTRTLTASRRPAPESPIPSSTNPSGDYILKVGTADNQKLWRAAFHANPATGAAHGTIIPLSGDWGAMSGSWSNNTLTLHRFDGINSRIIRLQSQSNGTLLGELDLGLYDPKRPVIAERITDQNKDLVASLPDPKTYTRMKNPTEPFRFSFPDLAGKTLANTDFKGKPLLVTITGSWCPNCHEEIPFLQSLYEKYHPQGLEIVALAFEYTGDPARDRQQLQLFADKYHVTFPLLLAGTTDDAPQKLPQLENFSAFPTTLFIGKDGLTKHIHAGFEGQATGTRFEKLKADTESLIKELL